MENIPHYIYTEKNISLMKINNLILLLCTRIILSSSFVAYFLCICHYGSFPINAILPSHIS